jgi:hypothetical protein
VNRRTILVIIGIILLTVTAFFLGRWSKSLPPAKKTHAVKTAKPRVLKQAEKARPSRTAKIAIVIDDFGYNKNNLEAFFAIEEPLTFSVLPNLPYSRDVAIAAKKHGCEVIMHLPMASHRKDVAEEKGTLKPGDSRKIVEERLAKDINSVPGLSGVSNHMGSLATEDTDLMSIILAYLKKRKLYFFDSLTSDKSVCQEVAGSVGIRFAKRDIFLDNSNNVAAIEGELASLKKLALKRGRAIAICHDRKNTAIALAGAMPQMAQAGIEFTYLSDMEK